jgi:hypothetical protein
MEDAAAHLGGSGLRAHGGAAGSSAHRAARGEALRGMGRNCRPWDADRGAPSRKLRQHGPPPALLTWATEGRWATGVHIAAAAICEKKGMGVNVSV